MRVCVCVWRRVSLCPCGCVGGGFGRGVFKAPAGWRVPGWSELVRGGLSGLVHRAVPWEPSPPTSGLSVPWPDCPIGVSRTTVLSVKRPLLPRSRVPKELTQRWAKVRRQELECPGVPPALQAALRAASPKPSLVGVTTCVQAAGEDAVVPVLHPPALRAPHPHTPRHPGRAKASGQAGCPPRCGCGTGSSPRC